MISVIIPVYNVEDYLSQCVDSILGQTYPDLEVLLVNDGSKDSSGKICDEYRRKDSRVKVFHTENHGPSSARNLAIREATGELLAFVDSDDWIDTSMYEKLLNRMVETGADISACWFVEEPRPFQNKYHAIDEVFEGSEALRALLEKKYDYHTCDKLYRRELFQGIHFPDGKTYEDVEIMHRLMNAASRVATIPEALYHYRIHGKSVSRNYSAKNLIDFADAYLGSYNFLVESGNQNLIEKAELLKLPAIGFSKIWRWWFGCTREEKKKYAGRIREMKAFAREHFPLFGYASWPKYLRLTTFFMHCRSGLPFAMLYLLNQTFRMVKPEKGKVVKE